MSIFKKNSRVQTFASVHFWKKFAGTNFREYPFLRKIRGYKLSRMALQLRFRGYKLSRTTKKLAKSRNFLPAKLSTLKVRRVGQNHRGWWIFLLTGFDYLRWRESVKCVIRFFMELRFYKQPMSRNRKNFSFQSYFESHCLKERGTIHYFWYRGKGNFFS